MLWVVTFAKNAFNPLCARQNKLLAQVGRKSFFDDPRIFIESQHRQYYLAILCGDARIAKKSFQASDLVVGLFTDIRDVVFLIHFQPQRAKAAPI